MMRAGCGGLSNTAGFALAVTLVVSGCGGSGELAVLPGRVVAEGEVLLDGRPLESGVITLVPEDIPNQDDQDEWFMANISEGQFRVQARPANYLVRIQQYRYEGRKTEGAPLLHEKYDQKTTLTAKLSEQGPNKLRFQLQSAPDQ